jgi:hypothetical protein
MEKLIILALITFAIAALSPVLSGYTIAPQPAKAPPHFETSSSKSGHNRLASFPAGANVSIQTVKSRKSPGVIEEKVWYRSGLHSHDLWDDESIIPETLHISRDLSVPP